MKRILSVLFAGIISCGLYANGSNPVVTSGKNFVKSGSKTVQFYKGGIALLHGNGVRSYTSLNIGTAAGYFSFGSVKAKNASFTVPEKGVFLYKAEVPEDKGGTMMSVSEEVSVTPMGTLEFQIRWKSAVKTNVKDMFYAFRFNIADFKDKEVLAGAAKVMVPNVTKYGFYNNSKTENNKITFYAWDPAKRFSVQCEGKVKVIMQCIKDKSFILRLYPAPGSETLNFSLLFQ